MTEFPSHGEFLFWQVCGDMRQIKLVAVVAPLLYILVVEWMEFTIFASRLPYLHAKIVTLIFLVGGVIGFSLWVFQRLQEMHGREVNALRRVEKHMRQLEALRQAGLSLTAELSIDTVLQKVVDLSCEVVGARYGALAVLGENGRIQRFITAGMSEEEIASIPHPPIGKGVLGTVIREQKPIRLSDLGKHPDSFGFPTGHPPMKSFLGVPIIYQGQSIGNLYLTEKIDDDEFSMQDQETLERFASQAAIAIANAQLYQQVEELAVLQERERISMDLHDGVIQSLFALGLMLEDSLNRFEKEPDKVKQQLDTVIERLNRVIGDIRHYIFDLRNQLDPSEDIQKQTEQLIEDMDLRRYYNVEFQVTGQLKRRLDSERRVVLYHMIREILTNVVKHANASQISIHIDLPKDRVRLRIRDDGQGFSPSTAFSAEHHGLQNLRKRAISLGGGLEIDSEPGLGTEVRVEVPAFE